MQADIAGVVRSRAITKEEFLKLRIKTSIDAQKIETCPHRGPVAKAITRDLLACGCQTIRLHACKRFNELVTIQPIKRPNAVDTAEQLRGAVSELFTAYKGRTCRDCKDYSIQDKADNADATIFHLTHRVNWQDVLRRSKFALHQHGIAVDGIELPKPNDKTMRKELSRRKPDIVFNHAFMLASKTTIELAREYPAIQFVSVNHSNQNHTYTWPQYLGEMRLILEATKTLPNLWLASPDAYMPWLDLGYERYTHWPNPVYLPPAPPIPAPPSDPPTLAIVGRTDWMKALPTQIAAAALVQRKRPLRVALLLNGEGSRKDGLYEHARACQLQYELPAWMPPEAWEAFLRDQVSVVCQPSMSESFNYVSLDGASYGRPFVGSEAIRHTPKPWRVKNPNDCYEIAAKLESILDDYPAASRMARAVAERIAERNNRAYAALVKRWARLWRD